VAHADAPEFGDTPRTAARRRQREEECEAKPTGADEEAAVIKVEREQETRGSVSQ
jgi:hypothetical protein